MIINDLDIERVSVLPLEADAPLLIDPDAVLTLAIAFQRFQLIRRRNHEIAQISGAVQILQFLTRPLLNLSIKALHELTVEHRLRVLVPEGSDHRHTITSYVINVKR
jgi:hypothetical protein